MSASPDGKPLRVVVADEHATTRTGIVMSLTGHGFNVIADVDSAAAAADAVRSARPDLCLLDAEMPGDPVAVVAQLASEAPDTAVVMLSASVDDERLFSALTAGARGYLLKGMDAARLPHALRGVLAGEAALPRDLMARVLDEFRGRRRRSSHAIAQLGVTLTEREWEVAELLREGLPTKVMADRLAVSPVTVRRHLSELQRKLGAPSRGDVVRLLDSVHH